MKPSRNTYRLPGCPAYEPQESHDSQLIRCRVFRAQTPGFNDGVARQVMQAIKRAHLYELELTTGVVY